MMAGRGTARSAAAGGPARHIPVLLSEVIDAIAPRDGGIYVDGTFGAGGYTKAILEAADCIVLAIDRDPDAIAGGQDLAAQFPERLKLIEGRFADMAVFAADNDAQTIDGVTLDVGVSSMQLDRAERGFSFQQDGPLDMRMSRSGPSAADIVNELDETDLAEIFRLLGEERRARAVARAIVAARSEGAIERTGELADIVVRVMGPRARQAKRHPATKTFQALRLFVNRELDELVQGLQEAERLLAEGGRLAVVTFHSLEDRIVKRFLASRAGEPPKPSRHSPGALQEQTAAEPSFRFIGKRERKPMDVEIGQNPRARSARLRAAERTGAPAHAIDPQALGLPMLRFAAANRSGS